MPARTTASCDLRLQWAVRSLALGGRRFIANLQRLQNSGIKQAPLGSFKTDRPGEPTRVQKAIDLGRFEELILPHLHAAHNLARWLLRSSSDAEDLVQEASLRAWRGFGSFRGSDARRALPPPRLAS